MEKLRNSIPEVGLDIEMRMQYLICAKFSAINIARGVLTINLNIVLPVARERKRKVKTSW